MSEKPLVSTRSRDVRGVRPVRGALPYLGFRISTFFYVAATNALLDVPQSPRRLGRVSCSSR